MDSSKEKNPSPGDIFTWKMNNSDAYQKQFMSDFTFAKQELDKAGLNINEEAYQEFTKAFANLTRVADRIFEIPPLRLNWVAIFVPPQKPYEKSE